MWFVIVCFEKLTAKLLKCFNSTWCISMIKKIIAMLFPNAINYKRKKMTAHISYSIVSYSYISSLIWKLATLALSSVYYNRNTANSENRLSEWLIFVQSHTGNQQKAHKVTYRTAESGLYSGHQDQRQTYELFEWITCCLNTVGGIMCSVKCWSCWRHMTQ